MRVAILLYQGFDELDAIGPFEVFRHAANAGAEIDVTLVTLDGAPEVTASGGLRVRPDGVLSGQPDLVLIPGGGWSNRSAQGAWAEVNRRELPARIRQLKEAGSTIATVCTGGMIAAHAGIVAGRPAVTHHTALEDLRATGARVINARVVDDGDLLMAGGVTSGIDLALWIVEREFGAAIADAVTAEMEFPRSRDIWRRQH
ncbi:MAG: DJ-1/PfpI family protein [Candidatus Dormibacteraeota bacterium]|nr:DJ-1/PfpI family protein [Candidatus Dormibacteraeota bacterium]